MGEARVVETEHGGIRWLHVRVAEGELGWMCLSPPALYPARTDLLPWLRQALENWYGAPLPQLPVVSATAVAVDVVSADGAEPTPLAAEHPTPAGPLPAQRDLVSRAAGAAVLEKAEELRLAGSRPGGLKRLVLGVPAEEKSWRTGLEGERRVGRALDRLPAGWHVLHAVPVGDRGSDIDHVVMGPAGVFTLNTKHHPGASIWVHEHSFRVNNHPQPYLRNARHEAERAGRLLTNALGHPVLARAVVVPVGAERVAIRQQPADVTVVPGGELVRWLRRRPTLLDSAEVAEIYAAARDAATWQPSAAG